MSKNEDVNFLAQDLLQLKEDPDMTLEKDLLNVQFWTIPVYLDILILILGIHLNLIPVLLIVLARCRGINPQNCLHLKERNPRKHLNELQKRKK